MRNPTETTKTERDIIEYLIEQVPDNFRGSNQANDTRFPLFLCEKVRDLRIERMQAVSARLNAPQRPQLVEKVA